VYVQKRHLLALGLRFSLFCNPQNSKAISPVVKTIKLYPILKSTISEPTSEGGHLFTFRGCDIEAGHMAKRD
jgi:hypothetical protein